MDDACLCFTVYRTEKIFGGVSASFFSSSNRAIPFLNNYHAGKRRVLVCDSATTMTILALLQVLATPPPSNDQVEGQHLLETDLPQKTKILVSKTILPKRTGKAILRL